MLLWPEQATGRHQIAISLLGEQIQCNVCAISSLDFVPAPSNRVACWRKPCFSSSACFFFFFHCFLARSGEKGPSSRGRGISSSSDLMRILQDCAKDKFSQSARDEGCRGSVYPNTSRYRARNLFRITNALIQKKAII